MQLPIFFTQSENSIYYSLRVENYVFLAENGNEIQS